MQYRLAQWHCDHLLDEIPRWTAGGLRELQEATAVGKTVDALHFTANVPSTTVSVAKQSHVDFVLTVVWFVVM